MSYVGIENVIEWCCYVTAILLVVDFDFNTCGSETGLRENWQWQLGNKLKYFLILSSTLACTSPFQTIGAVSVTMSWLNLLSNVRKFPYLGIYVVMFSDIMQTFLKFSMVCALFVIAFSMGFHALMGRQVGLHFILFLNCL